MERLVLIGVSHPGNLELTEGLVSIGRNPTNDFRIPDPTVSSFHCELIVSASGVVVRDLNSTNGTYVSGQPLQEAVVRPGQVLRLGNAELRLEARAMPEAVVVAIPEVPPPVSPPAQTHLLDGSLACLNHPGVRAIVRCAQCGQGFCAGCVRSVGLEGQQTRLFCPTCSGECRPIEAVAEKKRSLLGRLTQTIRIHLGVGKE